MLDDEPGAGEVEVDDEEVDVEAVVEVDDVESAVVSVLDAVGDVDAVVGPTVVATVVAVVALVVGIDWIAAVGPVEFDDSVGLSDGRPGAIGSLACGERTLGPICGPDGGSIDVVGVSLTSLTSSAGPPASESTVTALNASGAATANAVTVDSDSASRNRLPPDFSSGRC